MAPRPARVTAAKKFRAGSRPRARARASPNGTAARPASTSRRFDSTISPSTGGLIALIVVGLSSPALAAPPGIVSSPAGFSDLVLRILAAFGLVAGPAVLVALIALGILGPRAFRARKLRDVSAFPAWIWFLAAVAVLASMVFASAIASMALFPVGFEGEPTLREHVIVGLSSFLGGGIAAAVMVTGLGSRAPGSGLAFRLADVPRGLGAFLLAAPVVIGVGQVASFIEEWARGPREEKVVHELLAKIISDPDRYWAYIGAAMAIIAAPIVEEIVYRGFFQSTLLRATRSPWLAILVTGAVFSLMHLGSLREEASAALATLFALGIAMGIAYERTRSLIVPITMHIAYNAANVALALAMRA